MSPTLLVGTVTTPPTRNQMRRTWHFNSKSIDNHPQPKTVSSKHDTIRICQKHKKKKSPMKLLKLWNVSLWNWFVMIGTVTVAHHRIHSLFSPRKTQFRRRFLQFSTIKYSFRLQIERNHSAFMSFSFVFSFISQPFHSLFKANQKYHAIMKSKLALFHRTKRVEKKNERKITISKFRKCFSNNVPCTITLVQC